MMVLVKISATLFAGGVIIRVLTGADSTVAVIALIAVTVAYTALGGLRAVVWTEMLQTVVLLVGGSLVVGFAVQAAGGMRKVMTSLSPSPDLVPWDTPQWGEWADSWIAAPSVEPSSLG